MSVSTRGLPVAIAVLAIPLGACHRHVRSSPGTIDVAAPPLAIASERIETPGDPGERMLMITPGVVDGGFGRSDGRSGGELELEVGVHLGDAKVSHNDHALRDRLFLPGGLLAPDAAVGLVVGWSALRFIEEVGEDGEHVTTTGPLHARAQVMKFAYGAGAGWRWDPRTGETGPELSLWALNYELRVHASTDGEIETLLGLQLKWPVTWVWGR